MPWYVMPTTRRESSIFAFRAATCSSFAFCPRAASIFKGLYDTVLFRLLHIRGVPRKLHSPIPKTNHEYELPICGVMISSATSLIENALYKTDIECQDSCEYTPSNSPFWLPQIMLHFVYYDGLLGIGHTCFLLGTPDTKGEHNTFIGTITIMLWDGTRFEMEAAPQRYRQTKGEHQPLKLICFRCSSGVNSSSREGKHGRAPWSGL